MTQHGYLDVELAFARSHDDESFEDFLDCVLDELEKIDRSADFLASDRDLTATFTFEIEGDVSADVAMAAITDLRTALHAAHCNTGAWKEPEFLGATNTKGQMIGA